MLGEVEIRELPDPARQRVEISEPILEPRALDRQEGLALLARQPDLAPHYVARQRLRRDHQDEMLQRVGFQRPLDLAPPVAPAFERDEILPDAEPLGLQIAAQPRGKRRSVLAGV